LIYGVTDRPKTVKEVLIYALQITLSVWVATILIANVCGTPISSCLVGACLGTLTYQFITGFKSPMFISSCGATCSAVIGALAIGNNGQNYLAVAIGGLMIFIIYAIFAIIVKSKGVSAINKVFPPSIVGAVTIVIGLNLAAFIPTYAQINGTQSVYGVGVAIATMIVIALTSHYGKGFLKRIPFLIGLIFGYVVSTILTLTGVCKIIDFSVFNGIGWFSLPDYACLHWDFSTLSLDVIGKIALLFVPVAICALLEHYSDHKVLSNIVGVDLTETPGLHRTLLGDGFASFIGTVICGLPNTSYGESIATIGFSRVASTFVTTVSAIFIGILAFIAPVQAFISSIPACVFGGCAMILYGFIASSGLKTIINSKVDLSDSKNMIIISVILTIGVSGVFFLSESFTGVSLAMVAGVLLNIILKDKSNDIDNKDKRVYNLLDGKEEVANENM